MRFVHRLLIAVSLLAVPVTATAAVTTSSCPCCTDCKDCSDCPCCATRR